MNCEFFTIGRQNEFGAKFDLLVAILPALGSRDANVRADAAERFRNLLMLMGLSWPAVAYLLAIGDPKAAISSAAMLMPADSNTGQVVPLRRTRRP